MSICNQDALQHCLFGLNVTIFTFILGCLQVKNFGRRGRTKWTHLVNEDTTEFDNEIAPAPDITKKFAGKTAGTQNVFEQPPKPVR